MTAPDTRICPKCSSKCEGRFTFCPQCGCKLSTVTIAMALGRMTGSDFIRIFVGALILFGGGMGLRYYIHYHRGDVRPTVVFNQGADEKNTGATGHPTGEEVAFNDPELDKLRADVKASPDDIPKLKALAAHFSDIFRSDEGAPPGLVFEAIDTLRQILNKKPNDPETLLMMADISFDQKAFPKALEFYEKYLKLAPTDLGARARYASTLTFVGKFDEAINELNAVLKKDPKHFPATAYLAITYAQKGDKKKAHEVGDLALALAPSEEAKARFSGFIQSLDEEAQPTNPNSDMSPPRGNIPPSGDVPAVVQHVQNNPVAGPKFARFEMKDKDTIALYFMNFPMEQMPPFVKEKFLTGIKEKGKESGLKRVVLIDAANGKEMAAVDIQ